MDLQPFQEAVRSHNHLAARGGGSKTALSSFPEGVTILELNGLTGMIEYQPQEYTFTAYAGTSVSDVEKMLADNGQYLPFDPPLADRGASLGGTVAAGLSGPGRYRYGGIRDFLVGVMFLDGEGRLVRSGGKVVKNAAGFDLAKLMVGSMGMFGALMEVSFKVFPRPVSFATLAVEYPSIEGALESLVQLSILPLDIFALDLQPNDKSIRLLVRLGGSPDSLALRLERLRTVAGSGESILGSEEEDLWRSFQKFTWVPDGMDLVKIPVTPHQVIELDAMLGKYGALRWYSVGANLAWVAWPKSAEEVDRLLISLGLTGLRVLGEQGQVRLGVGRGETFAKRIKNALDPSYRWVEV